MANARLTNSGSELLIKEIKNPITWLFRHDHEVNRFVVKALDHGEGYLRAELDENRELTMFWADYNVMMNCLLKTRAWRNHFGGTNIYKACYTPELGWHTKTWTI